MDHYWTIICKLYISENHELFEPFCMVNIMNLEQNKQIFDQRIIGITTDNRSRLNYFLEELKNELPTDSKIDLNLEGNYLMYSDQKAERGFFLNMTKNGQYRIVIHNKEKKEAITVNKIDAMNKLKQFF